MSRATLLGAFVFIVAGLSGCASPAHLVKVDKEAGRVVVAVPEPTDVWPYYYKTEAIKAASEYIPDPVLVQGDRVKVGEQLTNIQDTTRRDIGGKKDTPKVGEVTTSTTSTSVSDRYEYQMVFESASKDAGNFLRKSLPVPSAPIPTGSSPTQDSTIKPVSGTASPGMLNPASDIRTPSVSVVPPSPQTNVLPPTYIPEPGRR